MKEIKLTHIGIAIIFFLSSWLIVQNLMFPQIGPPPGKKSALTETSEAEELPVLPQNERYNSPSLQAFSKDLPPFEESNGNDPLEPKDPTVNNKRTEL